MNKQKPGVIALSIESEQGGQLECYYDTERAGAFLLKHYPNFRYSEEEFQQWAKKQGCTIEEIKEWHRGMVKHNRVIFAEAALRHLLKTVEAKLREALDFGVVEALLLAHDEIAHSLNYKEVANQLIQAQKETTQKRLRAGRGPAGSQYEFLGRITKARRALREEGIEDCSNQEAVAFEMDISVVALRRQCRTYGLTWREVLTRTIPADSRLPKRNKA